MSGWIGVDLDGTLAHYDRWRGDSHIGRPIPLMVTRVRNWLGQGITVKIVTARVSASADGQEGIAAIRSAISAWCLEHIGARLEVTNVKDFKMSELWDDRAVQVFKNTGRTWADETPPARAAISREIKDREARDDLERGMQVARTALQRAGAQFRYYAEQHRLKGTEDGAAKSAVNSDMADAMAYALAALAKPQPQIARPIDEYHEDFGPVLWWRFPIEEPPYVGGPTDLGSTIEVRDWTGVVATAQVCAWPGYHTHWTPLGPPPVEPAIPPAAPDAEVPS